ncbi:MAG: phosphoenolpyruvate carboxylase, partial [Anaeromyxobacteraceae bacterium]
MARANDDRLRGDVHRLGRVLGETLAELRGARALDLVEGTRRAAQALRRGDLPGGRAAFSSRFSSLPVEDLALLAEAYTDFFHLVNAAEEIERLRALRARDHEGAPPVEGSIAAAVACVAAAGRSPAEVQALLDRMLVMPVLTAHPTEARRRTVLDHVAEAAAALEGIADPRAGSADRAQAEERLREVVTALVATRDERTSRPTPYDEVRTGLLVFQRTLLDAVPAVYRELSARLEAAWPGTGLRVPPFLRFGTWIGGDRDGNPFVTADVTRFALERQRAAVLERHESDARALWRELSAAIPPGASGATEALDASIAVDRERLGEPPAST